MSDNPVVNREQLKKGLNSAPDTLYTSHTDPFTFNKLLDQLGDHHELNIFFAHKPILPIIFVDEASALHFYPNLHAMHDQALSAGHGYALDGHHIVPAVKKTIVVADTTSNTKRMKEVLVAAAPVKTDTTTTASTAAADPGVKLDLSITNFVAYQWIAIILMTVIFGVIRGRYKKSPLSAPRGLQNVIESVVLYVHDQIVRPNVGTDKRAQRLMPYMLSLFFFILSLNLISLLPGAHAATGALPVTMALATCTLIVVNYIAFKDAGVGSWFKHLLGGAPLYIAPIMVPIEVVGIITKPFALMIRLFANMTAGHIVLLSLVGLIFFFSQEMGETVGWGVAPISVLFSVFIYLLELLVAFLQAYIFTMLSAVFVGLALGDHAAHDHHDHAASH